MAAAIVCGYSRTTRHYEKASIARSLAKDGHLKTDVSERLEELNDLRKDVQYGEPGPRVSRANLEELVESLESFLDEVEALLPTREKQR